MVILRDVILGSTDGIRSVVHQHGRVEIGILFLDILGVLFERTNIRNLDGVVVSGLLLFKEIGNVMGIDGRAGGGGGSLAVGVLGKIGGS